MERPAVPRGAVQDRLPVGGEPGAADEAAAKGETMEGRRRRGCPARPDEIGAGERQKQTGRGRSVPPPEDSGPSCRAWRGLSRRRDRRRRERLEPEGQVGCTLEPGLGAL